MYRLGKLPRDMREDLFNMYAVSVNADAREIPFYSKRVPYGKIEITNIIISKIPQDQINPFVKAYLNSGPDSFPPIVIADNKLIDGQHRIAAAKQLGIKELFYIDVTGLLDTHPHAMAFVSVLPESAIFSKKVVD